MCSKGSSSSPPVPSNESTAFQSATSPSQFMVPVYHNFVNQAQALAQTPFNPGMLGNVAAMNPQQTQAGEQLFQQGLDLGKFDPNQVKAIESPYTEDVVQATQDWFNNQNVIQGSDLLSQGIRSGNAFGGDRAGIAAARLAGQQQLAQAPVIAGLRQSGYNTALDEYNKLKQFGMAGDQAALAWGTTLQQQKQRELDVAQQNAMMQSAYPFQQMNWLGSILGGIGPLTGSFTQGYNTPPTPDALNQGLGIASSLIGLGSNLFGSFKRGGPVRGLARGGGFDDDNAWVESAYSSDAASSETPPPRKDEEPDEDAKAWANVLGSGGTRIQASRGPEVAQMPSQGGKSSQQQQQDSPWKTGIDLAAKVLPAALKYAPMLLVQRGGHVGRFQDGGGWEGGYDPNDIDTGRGSWYGQDWEHGWRDYGDRPGSNKLGVPESEQGIALPPGGKVPLGDYANVWMPGKKPGVDMPELARVTDEGPAAWTRRKIDVSAALANRAGYKPGNFPTDRPMAWSPVTAMGSPPGLPEEQYKLPGRTEVTVPKSDRSDPTSAASPSYQERPESAPPEGTPAAGGYQPRESQQQPQSGRRTEQIPGSKPYEETFADRLRKNPFWQFGSALLARGDPNRMRGIGNAMMSLNQQQAMQSKEAQLDQQPKMITGANGEIGWHYPKLNKIEWTGMKTSAANIAEANLDFRKQQAAAKAAADAAKPVKITQADGTEVSAVPVPDGRGGFTFRPVDVQQPAAAAPQTAQSAAQAQPPSQPVTGPTQQPTGVGSVPQAPEAAKESAGPASFAERSGDFAQQPPSEAATKLQQAGQQRIAQAQEPGPAPATQPAAQPAAAQPAAAQPPPIVLGTEPKTEEQKVATAQAGADAGKFKTPLSPETARLIQAQGMTPEQFDFTATRLALGDTEAAKVGGGKAAGAFKRHLQARASQYWIDQGLTPHEARAAAAELAGMKAGARSLATQEARITGAIAGAQGVAPEVLRASLRVDRTKYPDLNSVIMAYNQRTGDPNVVRLATSVHALTQQYGAAMSKGSNVVAEAANRRAMELLQKNFGHEQMAAAVDQMLIEMDREKASLRKSMGQYLGTTKQEPYQPGQVIRDTGGGQSKPDVRQNGVLFRWNGTKYEAVQ